MRRRSLTRKDDEAEVNMTPMLDIVFILLIFFIVTAKIITFQGVNLTQPPDDNQDPPPDTAKPTITVWVDETNRASVDGRVTEVNGVAALVERVRAEKAGANVVFRIHEDADFRALITIQDALALKNVGTKIEIVRAEDLQ